MENLLGKKFVISGMVMAVVADHGERWEMCNTTTKETIFMDKAVFEKAVKLGKAEEVTGE
jgi:hypothetical protein